MSAHRLDGITWDWTEAGRGALCALPGGVIILAADVSLGMVCALGTIPVAMLGVPARRSQRPRLAVAGVGFAIAYALGSAVGRWHVAAVVTLVVVAYAAVVLAARRPAAMLVPALFAPGYALGMNEPIRSGLVLAGVFLGGAAWAVFVAYLWPQREPAAIPPPHAQAENERATRIYAALFAAAAGIGLTLGYLLDFAHVAWAAAAGMFIMRPDPHLLASRALGRALATLAGVLAAGLIVRRGPTEIGLALIVVGAVSAMIAVRTSRWYVAPGATAVVVLLASGVASRNAFAVSFVDRLLETAIGAALALLFGVAVPYTLRALASSRERAARS